ncbi:MAG TPA: Mur ligase family protein [Ktedonobacterales bacterium]
MKQPPPAPTSTSTSSEHSPATLPPAPRARVRFRIRASAAIATSRATGTLMRRLRLGGGTSLPGLVARYVDPHVTRHLGTQMRHGNIVVTGTNGKTTTSGLVASVLRQAGLRVWRNREGSNLARGIATSLMAHAAVSGKLREQGDAAGVFEVDEAAFPQVVSELQPRTILVTNLFRDQLDRYGEVDTVAERWRDALATLPATTALLLNADDPAVAALADARPAGSPVVYFGIEDAPKSADDAQRVHVVDTRTCPRCRELLSFTERFYSHIGHWHCPACGFARPEPAVRARAVSYIGLEGSRFSLETPLGQTEASVHLPGLYNVYNALAAATAGVVMGATLPAIHDALERFSPAFGRGERIAMGDRTAHLLLAKNPTGLNEVLRALGQDGVKHHLLFILNDRAADGEDVSWIWDADFEQVARGIASLTTSGTRAYDLALRFKYAGVPPDTVESDIGSALTAALAHVPAGETLYIVPTYTAMLAVRGEISRRGYAPRYWEQKDA